MTNDINDITTKWENYVDACMVGTQFATNPSIEGFALHILRTTKREAYRALVK